MTAELITGRTTFSGVSIVLLSSLPTNLVLLTVRNRNAELPLAENCLDS